MSAIFTSVKDVLASIKNIGIALVLLICLIAYYRDVFWRGSTTLVEPIHVSEELKTRGYSEQRLQHMLVDMFHEFRRLAKSVTPKPSSKDEVSSDFDLPDISVPGAGDSVRPLIEYSRSLFKNDFSVSGSVEGSSEDVFSMTVTLHKPNGDTHSFNFPNPKDSASQTLKDVLQAAALDILKSKSPLTYAGYLTAKEQERCIPNGVACNFGEVRELYEKIAARESDGQKRGAGPAWARLALAKLDTFDHNLEGAIAHAREIVDLGETHSGWSAAQPWAHYSWGVALNDLGCYERAAEVLQRAVELNPDYAAAYNALGRSYLALARAAGKTGARASATYYRKDALDQLQNAIDLDPNYQEAYLNRGDALMLAPETLLDAFDTQKDAEKAHQAYRDAVALNRDTAAHAYERLVAMGDATYVKAKDRITKRRALCKSGMVRSLLESWGCTDAEIDSSASSQGSFERTAFQRNESPPAVCSKPELILHDVDSQRLPRDSQPKIVATNSAPSPTRERDIRRRLANITLRAWRGRRRVGDGIRALRRAG
jgi:tetratricopeptide (TPR) repeat protein